MTTETKDRVRIKLTKRVNNSYDVIIGENLFPRIARDVKKELPKISKFAIITDSNVGRLYAGKLEGELRNEGLNCMTFGFMAGEENKNMRTAVDLLEQLGDGKYNRDALIFALGGGVVGDTAGLVAGLINRGVPFIQIPTTTVSQADSAVGGKTGVDLRAGKNLAGLFKQPWRDYMDVSTLSTLDDRNYRAGLVEVIKHGVIQDRKFFEYLEQNMDRILARDKEALKYIARVNSRIKGTVVEQDPHEKGKRRILNYGHTAGHAIESASGYTLLHGEAVALGMRAASMIAYRVCNFPINDLNRQFNLLQRIGMPTDIPQEITNDAIIAITLSDKKAASGKARYCLPLRIGKMNGFRRAYATYIEEDIVRSVLNSMR